MRKSDKIVLSLFGLVYSLVTIIFIYDLDRDQSASLGYVFVFPIFWVIFGVLLFFIMKKRQIRPTNLAQRLLIGISTPIPLFIFIAIWFNIPSLSESPSSTYEFNKGDYRIKEVKYQYSNQNIKRIEYYSSKEKVFFDKPLPKNNEWLKDSVWVYYTKNGELEKKRYFIRGAEIELIID